jgi:Ca2+-binding EF-hand superfamily protein
MYVIIFIVMSLFGQILYANPAMHRFDKNDDHKISFAEAPPRMQENFHRHDLNKDGYITRDELFTLPKHHPKPHHSPPPPR